MSKDERTPAQSRQRHSSNKTSIKDLADPTVVTTAEPPKASERKAARPAFQVVSDPIVHGRRPYSTRDRLACLLGP